MAQGVVTRFAPSPTGFLHIGGARTALFNWLYARAMGGKMLLRIEDTDRERSTEPAVQAIIDGLEWMGLAADEPPVSQFERAARHREVVEQLLEAGQAYRCYASQAELEEMRERARAEKRPPRYDGRWRDRDPSEAPEGVKPVIRLRAPLEGETIVDDKVQGQIRFPNKDLDDFVLLRSDGNPTYMLAVVIDDHDMGVTHIIRGDDHLTNAGRQTLIYRALGWDVPVMAHIPLIHGSDGAKLSKRHGALGIEAYRAMGYLPVALRNYLVRLGWSHGDDEIISTEDMIRWFDVDEINKGAARFDFAKLEALNGHWIRRTDDADLVDMLMTERDFLPNGAILKSHPDAEIRAKLSAAMPGLKERAKTLVELTESTAYLFASRPLPLEEKAAAILDDGGRDIVAAIMTKFAEANWTAEDLEAVVRDYAESEGLKLGKVAQPLRAALTGRTTSPGVFDVLAVLGRDESLGRLSDQLR
ncbi:MAG: glutamate--tRNA ligase [Aurantimonas endophytica]|uniref:Glutamate--tRNA ligase n=1 Tax=Aurantimonas endophytica TaxID=1522175 RepID=A0A7W6HA69_9HYPH|nr:glutamate--tRNA ligase [Aurantimonas endophytica]MBB4001484.1 glutamyl-tRNA synthetase [Aurantimonas endophytica]MCO6402875.1 glutamate--tRNA ligase [Aurantimonas endophytica]